MTNSRGNTGPMPEAISAVVHAALSAWRVANGQAAHPEWSVAPDWMRESTRATVLHVLAHPDVTPEDLHAFWAANRLAGDRRLRPEHDPGGHVQPPSPAAANAAPSYADLPDIEKIKDVLVIAVVRAIAR